MNTNQLTKELLVRQRRLLMRALPKLKAHQSRTLGDSAPLHPEHADAWAYGRELIADIETGIAELTVAILLAEEPANHVPH